MAPIGYPTDTNTIVRTWTDRSCPTGEYYVQTADGQTWRTGSHTHATGEGRGVLIGNQVERLP